jgi:hypothetical protein
MLDTFRQQVGRISQELLECHADHRYYILNDAFSSEIKISNTLGLTWMLNFGKRNTLTGLAKTCG